MRSIGRQSLDEQVVLFSVCLRYLCGAAFLHWPVVPHSTRPNRSRGLRQPTGTLTEGNFPIVLLSHGYIPLDPALGEIDGPADQKKPSQDAQGPAGDRELEHYEDGTGAEED